jgi:hypothetical protein
VKVRIFEPPKVPLKSIDERNDFHWHNMSKHDEPKLGTPHDSGQEHTIDEHDTIFHGLE